MPTPTDLVTDLPADFEVFGQAVDTSMADLKGGTTGQILSKATNTDMDFTWITNDVGDITAVNVTAPITGGGSSGSVTIGVSAASTAAAGVVQLSDSTSTTSSVLASTPTATKSAYDLAAAAVPKSTVTTAGDVIYATGSSAVTRLGIGSAGQVLTVAAGVPSWATPSSGSNAFYAGKNKIINGDFNINQRAFTSNTTAGAFNFDRWYQINSGGSYTLTPQTFTPGAAPVSGYEGKTFLQAITASQSAVSDYAAVVQSIESVRSFAGQTVTISFWAKANTGTPKIAVELAQSFGTGGSPSAAVTTYAGQITLSTSWARYSVTVAVPSISGKTLGTNNNDYVQVVLWTSAGSNFNARTGSLGIQNFTAQIWGVQVEAGSTATDFQTASGSIGGELALCQRYYYRIGGSYVYEVLGVGNARSTTVGDVVLNMPVTMRTAPTSIDFSSIALLRDFGSSPIAITSVAFSGAGKNTAISGCTVASGLTAGQNYYTVANNSTSAYLAVSAEL